MIEATVLRVSGIPCLLIRDNRFDRCPVVVHYHGWSGHKGSARNPELWQIQLASSGVTVICPDCCEHGERQTSKQFRKTFNGWAFICDAMEQTRAEAAMLLDAILALPHVSTQRPQVSGISMGGLIAQMVFAGDPRWASLVSVIGRSSFHQADAWCREAQSGTWAEKWCDRFATQNHPDRFVNRPVLFIDGANDDDCPAAINAETVRRINALGGAAEQFVDPAAGHAFTASMEARMTAWLVAHAAH